MYVKLTIGDDSQLKKKVLRYFLSALLLLAIYIPLYATSGDSFHYKLQNFKLNQLKDDGNKVIITFKKKPTVNQYKVFKNEKVTQMKSSPIITASLSVNQIESLAKNSDVVSIEKDQKVSISIPISSSKKVKTKNVQSMSQLQDWGIDKIKAPFAWNSGYTGKGIKVAVIDTGVGPHEDLLTSGGVSFVPYTSSYADDNGHGTHVAGIISAENNSLGTVGVAPDADIYAVKALDRNGSGDMSNVIKGLDWAITNKMDIVNLSLGSTAGSIALKSICDKAYNSGILLVAAAGNNGFKGGSDNVLYPGKYSSLITVSAIDSSNQHPYFSSYGSSVDVSAPGVDIRSLYLNNKYEKLSGTSMATPYATGVLALLKQANPLSSVTQITSLLTSKTFDLGANGFDNYFGFGLVQAPVNTKSSNTFLTIDRSNYLKNEEIKIKATVTGSSNLGVSNAQVVFKLTKPDNITTSVNLLTNNLGEAILSIGGNNTLSTDQLGSYSITVSSSGANISPSQASASFTVLAQDARIMKATSYTTSSVYSIGANVNIYTKVTDSNNLPIENASLKYSITTPSGKLFANISTTTRSNGINYIIYNNYIGNMSEIGIYRVNVSITHSNYDSITSNTTFEVK